jgi:hypothetical protein
MNDLQIHTPPSSVKRQVTFTVPHVLLSNSPTLNLRQGGPVQVEATVTVDYYDAPVDEKPFVIKAKNQINFGALKIEVLNDAITGDKPIAPSSPTASEYMANVGKPVLTYFSCTPVGKKFKVVRNTIMLP